MRRSVSKVTRRAMTCTAAATAAATMCIANMSAAFADETHAKKPTGLFGGEWMVEASSGIDQETDDDQQNYHECYGAGSGERAPGYDIVGHGAFPSSLIALSFAES